MEQPSSPRRFAQVDAECRQALADRSRSLSRNERFAVEAILDLTYAQGFASLALTCTDDLADALEVGGRQNLHRLLRRLGIMQILCWDEPTGSLSVNPDPLQWREGPSTPEHVERAARATSARARLLAHQRITTAQGEFFPEPSTAEWAAQAAQERASSMPSGRPAAKLPLAPAPFGSQSDDRRPLFCRQSDDRSRENGSQNDYETAPRVRERVSSDAGPRQNHEHGSVAESNHDHGSDARGIDVATALELFWAEVGLPGEIVVRFRPMWLRRIIQRPLKVERCLLTARTFRDGGGRPNKGWGNYLNYLYNLGREDRPAPAVVAGLQAPPPIVSPVRQPVAPPADGEQVRQRQRVQLAEWRREKSGPLPSHP